MNNLADIKGVGAATIKKLAELSIYTPADVLNFFPKSYIDLKLPVTILETVNGQFSVIKAEILKVSDVNFKHRGSFSIKAKSGNAVFKIFFFNQPYLKNSFLEGSNYLFLGKVQFDGNSRVLFNPIFEKTDYDENLTKKMQENSKSKLEGIFTVYPTSGIISQNAIKKIVLSCLENFETDSFLSNNFCNSQNIVFLNSAYRAVHTPNAINEVEKAKERLALEDTINNIIFYQKYKKKLSKPRKVLYKTVNNRIVECKTALNKAFGFDLTKSQNEVAFEILSELSSDTLMNRIIVGDVGSGKTAVAFLTACIIAKEKKQIAMLAPTDILARQHYENFLKLSELTGISVGLLTASTSKEERTQIVNGLEEGALDFVIGTHSLLGESINFKSLSLIIFDEQQRFGVAQRDALESKAGNADILVLSATPIPRTIALMLYQNLNVSTIIKRQEATTNIKTRIISNSTKEKMFTFVANECKQGKKALFVCPKLFDSEGCTIYSAESLFKELKKNYFSDIEIGIIHGKQTSQQKSAALENLKSGNILALVCTSVIEVGIDVADVSNIIIMNSDRFGLSQLHQLRGRAGRDGSEAFCFLHTERTEDSDVIARLTAMVNTMDGFKIAERDFELRGGGDFLGLKQSGNTMDSCHRLKVDSSIILEAKRIVDILFSSTENAKDNAEINDRLQTFDFSRYFDSILGVTNN
ncbi:MAG: ATP-dependent DNA helicase RecG [Clostridia bacterium]|nr:ATP-dependent DNA helicase RecG [Clostridia bacterium]